MDSFKGVLTIAAIALSLVLSPAALAQNDDGQGEDNNFQGGGVPELDPGASGAALVLLIGGVAYIASRRRKENDAA